MILQFGRRVWIISVRIFSALYQRMLTWARHPHANYYLTGVSFAESSFFPIPPDAILAPMALAEPTRAWRYAFWASMGSVLGGIFGYAMGAWFIHLIMPWIIQLGYQAAYQKVLIWFSHYGFWAVLIAGFSPVPYKLFTLGAGAVQMAFLPFVIASCVSRAARFYLVAALMVLGGKRFENLLHRYIDWLGWSIVVLAAVSYCWFLFD